MRMSMCMSIHRCVQDAITLVSLGNASVLKCLLAMHKMMEHGDEGMQDLEMRVGIADGMADA